MPMSVYAPFGAGAGNFAAGQANSALAGNQSLSTGGLLGLLERILEKENNKVNNTLQSAENADSAMQQFGGQQTNAAQGSNQGNVEMLRAQQAVGELSTFNSAATNMMNSVNDSQKAVAQNTR
ncbi:hypothetical protein [Paraburkholderia bryophila]|jgi:hypothetical protein|uniref:Uncharacterized protein n=1 Tax=Paraburkholderia bryophila TaxID=420952 RepID=A0A329BRG2_9BURK|nr:hypothetical protein [Paraburkholderia bryophila]RAS21535.1 hypothetical protein BX591_12855 [Paraburkholderia bryophila]